ncbi:hypothetical protein [Paenibacillus urinalis]|uniref:Uncharacterized protein n=1 Tax=Paenibacillus urinalis TaxID=521520 RepID=A0AAX3N3R8_9BACL|nr:hypothetical protein [Paenibacillus urinalis]WDH83257.1 hypothetical protein PUW23_03150 [Paenibacillus urinalis]
MSIFFPDNDKRQARLIELSSDTQNFLNQLKNNYAEFTLLNQEINAKIADLYTQHGLTVPDVTSFDILQASGAAHDVSTGDTAVGITNILVDVASFLITVQYLAPGVTAVLVDSGIMAAETAATVLGSVLGVEIAVGTLAGGLIAGVIAAVVVVGIGLAIDAIEGAILRSKLRHGIHQMDQVRASLKLSLDKAIIVVESMKSIQRALDSLQQSNIEISDVVVRNIVQKTVEPALAQADAVTLQNVIAELKLLDQQRGSWTSEDEVPSESPEPHKVFLIAKAPESTLPAIPSDLKPTCLASPDTLQPNAIYPIIKSDGYTYWPLSYIDNRVGMAVVAFDPSGRLVKRFDKNGARYIVDITADPNSNSMIFKGQANQSFSMPWSELGTL